MPIRWNCVYCRRALAVADGKAGRKVHCPGCGREVFVPGPGSAGITATAPMPAPVHSTAPEPAVPSDVRLGPRLAILGGFALFLLTGSALAWWVFVQEKPTTPAVLAPDPQWVAQRTSARDVPNVGSPAITVPATQPAAPQPNPTPPPPEPQPSPMPPAPAPPGPVGPHSLQVSSTGNFVVVTDRLTGKEVWRKEAGAPVAFLAFGADGKTVTSRDQKGEQCVWDAATGHLVKRIEPPAEPPMPTAPAPETPTTVKFPRHLDPEELRENLLKVPEVDFYPVVDQLREAAIRANLTGKNFAQDQQIRQRFTTISPPQFTSQVNATLVQKAKEAGLPLVPREAYRLPLDAAQTMDSVSKELRTKGFVSVPGAGRTAFVRPVFPAAVPLSPAATRAALTAAADPSAHAQVFEDWCKQNRIEKYSGALNTLLQMLQVEDEATRLVLVHELAKVNDPTAIAVLARRAVFDLSPDVRAASIAALRPRKPETYRGVLVQLMRYPWPPAAEHAAEALATLDDKPAIPGLAKLLSQPDPCRAVYDDKSKKGIVHEVVRINHMRNCYLCHAASVNPRDLVRGAVPRAGAPLPPMYYAAANADFVQADVTYLRQDFSVPQPVEDAAPWPTMQRYDYMVRTRTATDPELAQLREPPPASYPQRDSVLSALRHLSGKDLGTASEPWEQYAAQLAPSSDTPPAKAPPVKPAPTPTPPATGDTEKPATELLTISPDSKTVALVNGTKIHIRPSDSNTDRVAVASTGKPTALAFLPNGSRLIGAADDKSIACWSATTGELIWKVSVIAVVRKLEVSADGSTVTGIGTGGPFVVNVATGKLMAQE